MSSPLLRSLFDEEDRRPLTVSELNAQVRSLIESRFASVWVEGEITNFVAAGSGHWYFTLNDGSAQLRAACFRGANSRIRFKPANGVSVRVRGRLTIYEARGEYQISVESLEPVGEGALRLAFEQIRAKLDGEGLFALDLKRKLPLLPRRVGVITSATGAAFHDVYTVLTRRTRSVSILLIPTLVQGEGAADAIRRAVIAANEFNAVQVPSERIDVLIVGRGGGSSEDLWAFNDEALARALRASTIPVISAVGHEIDVTICDFVADLRAATPSAAAELVASCEEHLVEQINSRTDSLGQVVGRRLLEASLRLQGLAMSPVFVEFPSRIDRLRCELDDRMGKMQAILADRLNASSNELAAISSQLSPLSVTSKLGAGRARLMQLSEKVFAAARRNIGTVTERLGSRMASLDALSPLSVLDRGYSITQNAAGHVVRNANNVKVSERLSIRLARGRINADVVSTEGE